MKSTPLQQQPEEKLHLKIVKKMGKVKSIKNKSAKIYINTLIPGFSFINHKGNVVEPKKCVLL